ncbi:MAG: flagellar hook protein [Nitrospinota bacterium]|nr:MAG: flagellar hook protein [Nitrospinota bacterium]
MALGSISSLGIGSSLDLQGILDQLREAEEAPITRLEEKKADIEAQLEEFDTVNSKLLSVKTHALNLSLPSNFLERNVSVSNENVLTASVATGTTTTSTTVEVIRLASRSSFQSSGVADADAALISSDTVFEYKLGTGDTISLSVANGTTLNQLAELINDDPNNPGVTATVIDDGSSSNPFRLVLTADATGEENRISIVTPLADLPLTEVQGSGTSLNAEIKVNGITYERQSNTGISDVLQGITLNLHDVGTVSIQVTADTSSIQEEIVGLVESLNDAVQEIKTNSSFDEETGEFGLLTTVSSIRGLSGELTLLLGTSIPTGGTITSLYDLGMEVNRDGTITIDEEKVADALANNLDEVMTLFAGDEENGITGLGTLLNDRLRDITGSNGLIATEKEASLQSLDRLEEQIENSKAQLDRRFEILTRQFVALDSYLSQVQSQSNFLSQMIESFNTKK